VGLHTYLDVALLRVEHQSLQLLLLLRRLFLLLLPPLPTRVSLPGAGGGGRGGGREGRSRRGRDGTTESLCHGDEKG